MSAASDRLRADLTDNGNWDAFALLAALSNALATPLRAVDKPSHRPLFDLLAHDALAFADALLVSSMKVARNTALHKRLATAITTTDLWLRIASADTPAAVLAIAKSASSEEWNQMMDPLPIPETMT